MIMYDCMFSCDQQRKIGDVFPCYNISKTAKYDLILSEMTMILRRTYCGLSLIICRTWAFSSWLCAIGHVIVFLFVTETKDHSNLYCLRGKLKQSDVGIRYFFRF